MSHKKECGDCSKYREEGHNYCRVCGNHLTAGTVQMPPRPVMYHTNEQYCGHCGGPKRLCKCLAH